MRITIDIDDDLFNVARSLSGVEDCDELVLIGLKTGIERECARRLARLGGTESKLNAVRRRKSAGN